MRENLWVKGDQKGKEQVREQRVKRVIRGEKSVKGGGRVNV